MRPSCVLPCPSTGTLWRQANALHVDRADPISSQRTPPHPWRPTVAEHIEAYMCFFSSSSSSAPFLAAFLFGLSAAYLRPDANACGAGGVVHVAAALHRGCILMHLCVSLAAVQHQAPPRPRSLANPHSPRHPTSAALCPHSEAGESQGPITVGTEGERHLREVREAPSGGQHPRGQVARLLLSKIKVRIQAKEVDVPSSHSTLRKMHCSGLRPPPLL